MRANSGQGLNFRQVERNIKINSISLFKVRRRYFECIRQVDSHSSVYIGLLCLCCATFMICAT